MKPLISTKDVLVLTRIVDLVRSDQARTRSEIENATGLGRAIVNDRLREAMGLGLLAEGELAPSAGGRPSRTVRFRSEAGVLLCACLGSLACRAGLATLDGDVFDVAEAPIEVSGEPDEVLTAIDGLFRQLLERNDPGLPVWGIGVGIPGPVEFKTGRVIAPPALPRWDGFDVRAWFRGRYEAPVWVDNEVNLMALGEWEHGRPRDGRDLLYFKVGTGIGSGLVTSGRLHRGDSGAAGDIGHVRVTDDPTVICRCGKTGCLAAVASGSALVEELTAAAASGSHPLLAELLAQHGRLVPEDIGRAAAAGDTLAVEAVQRAAEYAGRAIAGIINFVNPGTLVVGGGVLRMSELFFEQFRRAVLDGTIELAARRLTIRKATLDFSEGVYGAASIVANGLFQPDALALWIANGSPIGSAIRLQLAS